MTAYCYGCGRWRLLDVLLAWCAGCIDQWRRNYRLVTGGT